MYYIHMQKAVTFIDALGLSFPYCSIRRIHTGIHLFGKEGIQIQEQKGPKKPIWKNRKRRSRANEDVNRYLDFHY